MDMKQIERLATTYSKEYDDLVAEVDALNADIEAARKKRMSKIKRLVDRATSTKAMLRLSIEEAPDLFRRPKTVKIAGIKVGYAKQRGKVEFDDEEKVIARIRKLLPEDQAELMIRVEESVDKTAAYNLSVDDAKRLGISITADCDAVVIKTTGGDIEKLVNKLIGAAESADAAEDDAA